MDLGVDAGQIYSQLEFLGHFITIAGIDRYVAMGKIVGE